MFFDYIVLKNENTLIYHNLGFLRIVSSKLYSWEQKGIKILIDNSFKKKEEEEENSFLKLLWKNVLNRSILAGFLRAPP